VEAVERFWLSLADNVVLLMVMMPLVGSGLVRFLKSSGSEPVYFTGLVNVWLTAGLTVIMVASFRPGQPDASRFSTRMTSSLSWLAEWKRQPDAHEGGSASEQQPQTEADQWHPYGPDIRLSVGVNRYSLWFLVLTVATTLAVFRSISADDPRLISKLSWLLFTESAMLGAFAAQDVILLAMCCQLSTLGLFFLIGQGSDPARREAARRFFRMQTVSGMLILFGLVGTAICHWWMLATVEPGNADLTFSLRRIVASVPRLVFETDAARDLWATVSPWLFISLCSGFVLRLPLPPFHHWWFRVSEHADSRVVAMMAVGYLPLSFYAAVRILVPLFPEHVAQIAPRLFLWGFLSAMFLVVSAVAMNDPRRKMAAAGMAGGCVAFVVALFGEPSGTQGGLLLTVAMSGSLALLHLSVFAVSPGQLAAPAAGVFTDSPPSGTISGDTIRLFDRLPILIGLAGLSAIPLSGSFWGELLILQSIFRRDATAAFWLMVAAFVLAISIRSCWRDFFESPPQRLPAEDSHRSISRQSVVNVMPIILVLAAAAVAPQWIIGPSRTATAEDATARYLIGDESTEETAMSLQEAKRSPGSVLPVTPSLADPVRLGE